MHDSALMVISGPVAEDLITIQHSPVLLESIRLRFEVARAFHIVILLLTLGSAAKALDDLIVDAGRSW